MEGHPAAQFGGRVEGAFTRRLGLSVLGAAQWMDGDFRVRDAIVAGAWRPTKGSSFTLTVRPGFTLPFAGISETVAFTPLGTRSVDPFLGVDVVGGGAWVGAASAQVQAPLVAGRDGWRQGLYGRLDLRVARRFGQDAVVFTGVSGISRAAGQEPNGNLSEVAWMAGGLYAVSKRVGLNMQVRAPVFMKPARTYNGAVAFGVTYVAGKPREPDDADDHGDEGGESQDSAGAVDAEAGH
jgi:hypothetical protein